jgi:hypothetical protein
MTEAAAAPALMHPLPTSSVRVLLQGVVDYAGLFPPASLDMAAAAAEYAEHRAGPYGWALGRFVLPAARLEEFEESAPALLPRLGAESWALSALLGSDIEQDIERIEVFNERHRDARSGAVLVDTVETKTHSPRDVERAAELLDRRFDTYMEVPVGEDPADLLAAIAQTTAKAKIRTGGVTPDAFPSSAQVARFLSRCVARNVAFKATAGLHHPLRAEYRLTYASDAPTGTMFGFLNVLLAVAALRAGEGLAGTDPVATLDERESRAFEFDDLGVRWRGRAFPLDLLTEARDSMVTFGSCSFREPVDALRAMSLL